MLERLHLVFIARFFADALCCIRHLPAHHFQSPTLVSASVGLDGLARVVDGVDAGAVGNAQVELGCLQDKQHRPPGHEVRFVCERVLVRVVRALGILVGDAAGRRDGCVQET